jgi:hypothetical protein
VASQPRTGRASLPDVRCVARAARGRRQCRKSAIPTSEPPTCRTHAKTVPHTVGPRPLEPGVPPVTERVPLLDPPPPRPPTPPTVEVAPGRRVPVAAVTAWHPDGRPLAWEVPVPAELSGQPGALSTPLVPRDPADRWLS